MIILAIDTSCDDTCIAILKIKKEGARRRREGGGNGVVKLEIKSNVVSSQVEIHRKYGGVYPSLAKREHQKNLPVVLKKTLKEAKLSGKKPRIDAIAVTVGPGLDPCLWMGINFAKDLAQEWELPIIPVNHIESHIFANWLNSTRPGLVILPAMCLIVSGGHTQLILMKGIGDYKIIGETRDDAAGECFDKTARVLGLGYPGGPAIAAKAAKLKGNGGLSSVKLPRPMINSKDYDFSFSGLKTAVLYDFKKRTRKVRTSKEYVREMAREIQQAIVDVLIKKTIKATRNYQVKTIMLGGGVAANKELRGQFQQTLEKEKLNFMFHAPSFKFCTDNAAMVGIAGYFNRQKTSRNWQQIKANANLRI